MASSDLDTTVLDFLARGDARGAAQAVLLALGPEIAGYLRRLTRSDDEAADAFEIFCVDICTGIHTFRGESSVRTWAYNVARNARRRLAKDGFACRRVPLSAEPWVLEIEQEVRSTTAPYLRTDVKARFAALREKLTEDQVELLVLHVDRKLEWEDVALVMLGPDAPPDDVRRKVVALRKAYERLVKRLRDLALAEGPSSRPSERTDAMTDDEDEDEDDPALDDPALLSVIRGVAQAPPVDPAALGAPGSGVDPRVGTTFGKFAVLERIGAGGMGVVYQARDMALDRVVALKLVRPDHAGDPARRRRLLREAASASQVAHPAVATIYEAGEHEDVPFIAMEHLDGPTLRALLRRGRLSAHEALRLALRVAEGLAAAHERSVLHLDLTAGNVIVVGGSPKIVDFGLARIAGRHPPTTGAGVLGTQGYMAPERLAGQPGDARSDVFSFGVVLHELLDVAREAPACKEARRIAETCRAHDPAERYPDGAAVARALSDLVRRDARSSRLRTSALMIGAALAAAVAAYLLGAHRLGASTGTPSLGPSAATTSTHPAAEAIASAIASASSSAVEAPPAPAASTGRVLEQRRAPAPPAGKARAIPKPPRYDPGSEM